MAVIRRRVRSRPIRYFLIGMFAVPLISVVGLWAFLTSITVNNAINDHNFNSTSRAITSKGALLSLGLTEERAQSYLWLIADRKTAKNSLLSARALVSEAVASARSLNAGGLPLAPAAQSALQSWFSDLGRIGAIRSAVDSGAMSPSAAFSAYTGLIDAEFHYYYSAIQDTGGTLAQPSIGSADAAYANEMANREAVLADGALADHGTFSAAAQQAFAGAAANRQLLMNDVVALLPPTMSAPYVSIENSASYRQFQALEQQIISSLGSSGPIPVNAAAWQSASQAYLGAMLTAELNSGAQLATSAASLSDRALTEAVLAGSIGLAAVVASGFLMAWFGRKLTRDLRELDGSVRAMAEERLPRVVERLRRGDDVDVLAESPPPAASAVREISQIAVSFATVQEAAVAAAVEQARLRKGVSQVFLNISMRNQSLLHRQVSMLDSMERRTSEPGALADLFRLDHLTTRMRRHAEGLIILSGSTPARGWRNPVPVVDVLRAAVAEVEEYVRVDVVSESRDLIAGIAVNDLIHLFAELVENATVFSPPNTRIEVRADRVGNGLVAEIEDRGLGLSEEELADINGRLARPAEFDLANSEQLGLFVVSRLAARHSIAVTLRRSAYGGTTAILLLPFGVIVRAEDADSADSIGRQQGDLQGAVVGGAGAQWQQDVARPAPLATQPGSPAGGLAMPSPLPGLDGRLRRLRAAQEGWPADDGAAITGQRPDNGAVLAAGRADDGAAEAPAHPPSTAEPTRWPGDALGAWPDAFRPAVRRAASAGTDPAGPLPTPRLEPEVTGPASSGTHLGMPVRVPQGSLAPQLRSRRDTGSQPAAVRAPGAGERSPEATRDMLILMQEGWQRGRLDDLDQPEDGPESGREASPGGPPDSEAGG
jgi:signal transduction histidine kinase